ncbi:unnamed protein product [Choristocarpus tenellus]
MGAKPNCRWIKPKLKLWQGMVCRMDLACDQVDWKRGVYASMANTIHATETWFYMVADGERVRIFPHEDDSNLPGSPAVQHKSHIPKTMIIAANAHPGSAHSFDGKLGVWRVCAPKTAERTSKNHKKGDVYEQDCTLDQVQEAVHRGFTACNQDQEALSIRPVTQPSKSPDLNIMDLYFFRSLKYRVMGKQFGSIKEMVKVIK